MTPDVEPADWDGKIVSIPAGADLAECEQRGRDDFARGVSEHDSPYVCGHPFYAWERGWAAAQSEPTE